ncbi:MAG: SusC/RagA family TonB-linked outer membrane protein [Balneolaceae bacterium]|nr:MAG: SusC/RagA family TonB-linked outer membrane protein [Balneolaceae bacterium]
MTRPLNSYSKVFLLSLMISVLFGGWLQAQTVRGTVTDADTGEPLPGVNILLEGTTSGTSTTVDGIFEISVPSLDGTLIVSFIGYETQRVDILGRTEIDVSLRISRILADEVVVIGYGTQRRAEVTTSISTISTEQFNRGHTESPEQLMQGRIAGVNITSVSGQPGSPQTITIRGPGTPRAGSGPLYVIDGVAIDNNADTSPGGRNFGPGSPNNTNPLSFLNPNDIESITVLKDASATAIYGSRAANGVILITTKTGERGVARLSYNGSLTISGISNKLDMLSPDEFADFHRSIGQPEVDMGNRTNYFDEILRTAYSNRHSLSYSGGSETMDYTASLNFSNQEGIIIANNLQNFGGRVRLNQRFLENRLNVGFNLLADRQRTDYVPVANTASTNLGDMLTNSLTQNPTQPIYNPDGSFYEIRSDGMNPVQVPEIFTDFGEVTRILGKLSVDFEIVEGLMYRFNTAIDNSQGSRSSQVSPHNNQRIDAPNGAYSFNNRENSMFQTESTLNYLFSVENHSFDLLGGFSYQSFLREGRGFSIRDFTTTEINAFHNPGIGSNVTLADYPNGFSAKNELQSYFTRLNYNFAQRYFVTATLRADGSSRFGNENRYGYFPSFSAAWQISDENFYKLSTLNSLKLRAGWGQTGNQDIPDGITQQRINVQTRSGYELNPGTITPGITFIRTQNENIRWEVSTQANIGIDFALFNDALNGSIDLYRKVTSDILLETTSGVDPVVASSSFWSNYDMEVVNRGIELDLNYRRQLSPSFSFDIGGNISFLDNVVQNLPVEQILTGSIGGRGLSGETVQAFRNGLPFGSFWVFDFQGLDANGNNVFRDVDGDGIITNADRISPGSALPDFTYGLSANMAYRSWNLGLNFNGVSGNMIYWNDHNALFNMPQLYAGNNIARVGFDPGESSTNPATASSRFLYDGSYFRLNNATLSYSVNSANLPVNSMQFAITGRNLFTITDYPGFDPEVDKRRDEGGFRSIGIDGSRYPSARSVTFSVTVTL